MFKSLLILSEESSLLGKFLNGSPWITNFFVFLDNFSSNFIVGIQIFLLVCIVWARTGLISRVIRGSVLFPSIIATRPIKVPRIALFVIVEITTIRNVSSIEDISIPRPIITRVWITGSILIAGCRQVLPIALLTSFSPGLHIRVGVVTTILMSSSSTKETSRMENFSLVHVCIALTIFKSPNFILSEIILISTFK